VACGQPDTKAASVLAAVASACNCSGGQQPATPSGCALCGIGAYNMLFTPWVLPPVALLLAMQLPAMPSEVVTECHDMALCVRMRIGAHCMHTTGNS
jgi:hypothetical protein